MSSFVLVPQTESGYISTVGECKAFWIFEVGKLESDACLQVRVSGHSIRVLRQVRYANSRKETSHVYANRVEDAVAVAARCGIEGSRRKVTLGLWSVVERFCHRLRILDLDWAPGHVVFQFVPGQLK